MTEPKEPELQVIPLQPVTPLQPNPRLQMVTPTYLPPPPKDYLFLSILAIFFFLPLAILALVFSLKVGTPAWLSQLPLTPILPLRLPHVPQGLAASLCTVPGVPSWPAAPPPVLCPVLSLPPTLHILLASPPFSIGEGRGDLEPLPQARLHLLLPTDPGSQLL